MKEMKQKIENKMRYWINNYVLLNNKLAALTESYTFAKNSDDLEEINKINEEKKILISKRDDMLRMFKNCDDLYLTEVLSFIKNLSDMETFDKELKKLVNDIAKKIQTKVDNIHNLLENARAKRDTQLVLLLTTTERLMKENTKRCFGISVSPSSNNKRGK